MRTIPEWLFFSYSALSVLGLCYIGDFIRDLYKWYVLGR